jgi:hypothetical protein
MLLGLLVLYACASFVHFAHNAEFLGDYPNLPDFITRSGVYFAWIGQAAIGLTGFLLYRCGWRRSGLLLIAVYAAFGCDGLLHYMRAPMDAHTAAMNFTIWFEVIAAAALLWVTALASIRLAQPRATKRGV